MPPIVGTRFVPTRGFTSSAPPDPLILLTTRRSELAQLREGYMQALIADSLNPLADYSLDGESTSREAWRAGMMNRIEMCDKLIARLRSPYQRRLLIETI
jgi:hypothetical protein